MIAETCLRVPYSRTFTFFPCLLPCGGSLIIVKTDNFATRAVVNKGYAKPGNKQIGGIVERLIRDAGAEKTLWVPSRNYLEQESGLVWSCPAPSLFYKAAQSTETDCIALCELWKAIQSKQKPARGIASHKINCMDCAVSLTPQLLPLYESPFPNDPLHQEFLKVWDWIHFQSLPLGR